jgi:gluconolactonase
VNIKVEQNDAKIREIVPDSDAIEHLATGFGFTEGPIWCGDYLLFSDIPRGRIVRLQMFRNGPDVTTFRCPSGNSNGLTLDRNGRLIACEHSTRRVTRTGIDGTITVLADSYQGKRLNSPNDVVVRSDGSIYFTDPSYGLGSPPKWKEQPVNGVYKVAPDGKITLLADDFNMPNGLAFSPDESVLYVDDTAEKTIRRFDVSADGSISNGRIFLQMQGAEPGAPDGMKVDQQGNIYCTGPGGIWIAGSSGRYLGRILMPEQPANFGWGDADWRSLYITARTSIFKLRFKVPGIPVGLYGGLPQNP